MINTSIFQPTSPSIPSVRGLPVLGNLLELQRDRIALQERAAAIGPLARVQIVTLPIYVVSDADLAHDVFVTNAADYTKSPTLGYLEPVLGKGLLTATGDDHKRHRKLLAPAFAPKRLAAYGEIMVEETERQVALWQAGAEIDVNQQLMELTLAIAGRTLFSADVRNDAKAVSTGLDLSMHAIMETLHSPIRLGYRWPLPRNMRLRRAVAMLDDVVLRLIADGRRANRDRGDVLSILLSAQDEAGGLSDRQIRDEVMTLLLAGHETTANALSWTWYELGRHPEVYARLVEEIASLGDRRVTPNDLANLPWNLAVIEEAMRLHPPAFDVGREAMRDVVLGGHTIPAGSMLVISVRNIHRRADYFADPLRFDPERMLPSAKQARPRHHYLPFGAGPRVCIGSHFALLEAQLLLATMVQHVRLRMLRGYVAPEPLITLRPRGGLPALVEYVH